MSVHLYPLLFREIRNHFTIIYSYGIIPGSAGLRVWESYDMDTQSIPDAEVLERLLFEIGSIS
jgi:hypothetical protein